ncbi:MAG: hypothetical protein WBX27_07885 [Specibacter sp.]
MTVTSSTSDAVGVGLVIFVSVLALCLIAYGIHVAGPWNRKAALTLSPSRRRSLVFCVVSTLGLTSAAYFLFTDPHHLIYASLWPLLMANAIPAAFRPAGLVNQGDGPGPLG